MFSEPLYSKFKSNKLLQRTISASIFVPIVLFFVYIGGIPYSMMNFIFLCICMYELIKMTKISKPHWKKYFILTTMVILSFIFNMIYIRQYGGFNITLLLFLIVWTTDTSAYFFGIIIGGKKLALKFSPNKTWAGFLGALFCSGIIGYIAHQTSFINIHSSCLKSVCSSIFISFCSQCGDLSESALKRYFEVKDSGNCLPGHGGLLDRFDGLSFASIAMFITLLASGY
jgi:phosphatidate cytidylyltransferase